jgi:predicted nucleic acid-binding Zn ribbon protein
MTWKKWSPVDDSVGEPRLVGESLAAVARQLGLSTPEQLAAVFGDWEGVVGPVLAAHSRPDRMYKGELVVIVEDPAWATELRFLGSDIASKINAATGAEVVTSVVVWVSRETAKRSRFSGRAQPRSGAVEAVQDVVKEDP